MTLVPLYLHTGLVFGTLRTDKMLLACQATLAITFLVEQHFLRRMETKHRKKEGEKKWEQSSHIKRERPHNKVILVEGPVIFPPSLGPALTQCHASGTLLLSR